MAYDGSNYASVSDDFYPYLDDGILHNTDDDATPHARDKEDIDSLKKQASRLSHLLQVMPAGVIVLDGKGVVKQANGQATDLLGEPLEGELWRVIIARSFNPRADDGYEVSLIDGRRVKLSITPLDNEPGQLIVLTDLTETRQLQARVSHMQRLSALGKMVASLAHQVRTPLSAAMLYASNIKRRGLGEEATANFADKLSARLKELEGQVNDMLLFAKSGEDQVVADINILDLADILASSAQSMMQQASQTLRFSGFDGDSTITGNLNAIQGAMLNLIHNASQVSDKHTEINVQAITRDGEVTFSVIDSGPGIPIELQQKIFEPFYTTKTHGTGLGLAVVKSVVNAHGGKLSVINIDGHGASFSITMPLTVRAEKNNLSPEHTGELS